MKKTFIHFLLLLFYAHTYAQEAFTNSGNLQLHPGASVTGFGNFINSSSGVLVNNSDFYLKQNITNDQAAMTLGTGTLYMNGSSAQTIYGVELYRAYNFVSNNTAGITLNNNLSVSGVHTFTAGLIYSSATPNYLVYEAGSSYTGSSDARHANGWIKKIGSTDFSFPVGNGIYIRPASVENLSGLSEINCHYYAPTQNISSLALPIRMVKANEYWQINRVSGGDARVDLNWDHSKVPMDNMLLSDIAVVHFSGGYWNDRGGTATGNTATTGSIKSNALNSFGAFTLGYKTYPVPLKLLSFTGERRYGTNFLNWKSENEQLVDRFDVERSYDATGFTTIGAVAARNLDGAQDYAFQDHSPLDGIAYYRLRTVDQDGRFAYSQVVVLSDKLLFTSSFAVQNPARQDITVFNKTGKAGSFEYRLFGTGGQLILKGNTSIGANGGVVIPLPVQTAGGIYILELSNEHIQYRQKILVEK